MRHKYQHISLTGCFAIAVAYLRQGLSYSDDGKTLFETTGLYRQSKVRRINPNTFKVEKSVDTDSTYFGEGSAFFRDADGNGRLIELTWREQTGFIYDSDTLKVLRQFKYTTTLNMVSWK